MGHKAEIVDPDDASNKLPSKKLMPSAIDGAMRGAAIRLHEAAENARAGRRRRDRVSGARGDWVACMGGGER